MNKKKALTVILTASAAVIIAAAVLFDGIFSEKTAEKSGVAMGSVISVALYGDFKEDTAGKIISRASEIENSCISRYKETSEIYKLNESGEYTLSEYTAEVLCKLLKLSEDSLGAFDVTIGNLTSIWDFDDMKNQVPEENDIKNALKTCGYTQITEKDGAYKLGENQKLDLGAAGKGLACDEAFKILKEDNVSGAVVSAGGTVLVYGENSGGKDWTIGIKTPEKDNDGYFAKLALNENAFISTSGNYEKSFEKDGKLYHHILSPSTGYPAESGLKSVTVISKEGLISDGLSTACFVLGYEKSLTLLEKYGAQAVFVTEDNKVLATEGIKDSLTITDENYIFN